MARGGGGRLLLNRRSRVLQRAAGHRRATPCYSIVSMTDSAHSSATLHGRWLLQEAGGNARTRVGEPADLLERLDLAERHHEDRDRDARGQLQHKTKRLASVLAKS